MIFGIALVNKMYISRVEIDIENRRKIKNLTHLGAYHHWVEESFPEEIKIQERTRKLWRIDKIQNKNYLIIVSRGMPDIQAFEKYGVEGSAQTKSYDPYIDSLQNGQRMKFRVILNPSITLSEGSGNRGRTKPHVTLEHQLKYLMDRAEQNGFILNEDEFTIVERGYGIFRKSHQKSIRWVKVAYEGTLTIENIDIFKKTLTNGFGKHKAYGFGMMTVIPLHD